jgi:hypothetical protein
MFVLIRTNRNSALFKKNNLKPLPQLKKLRADSEAYEWMLDNIVPLIVGAKYYKEQSKLVLLTVWLTRSSEALAILCLENYYESSVDAATNKTHIRKPKWTSDGIRAKRNQGWKQEGISKFDAYCVLVGDNRADNDLIEVDMQYLERKKSELTKEDERKRK